MTLGCKFTLSQWPDVASRSGVAVRDSVTHNNTLSRPVSTGEIRGGLAMTTLRVPVLLTRRLYIDLVQVASSICCSTIRMPRWGHATTL